LPEAVAAPRASQRNSAAVAAEEAFRTAFEAELTPFGHQFTTAAEIGAVAAIEVDEDGLMTAVRRAGASRRRYRPGGGAGGLIPHASGALGSGSENDG
jgi:gamma-glutamyltranspeptidase/glutathione hydrolase